MPGEHDFIAPTTNPKERARFVWPPLTAEDTSRASMRTDAGETNAATASASSRGSIDLRPIGPAAIPRPRFPTLHAALLEIETVWLGQTRAPFADRAEAEKWSPDGAAAYCPRCGVATGQHEALDPDELGEGVPIKDAGCPECRGKRLAWERFVRLGEYRGLLQEAVLEVKFSHWKRLGRDLGELLGEQLVPLLDRAGVDRSRLALVPVPIPFWRRVFRGIDHTLAITRGVRDSTGGRIANLLHRRGGQSQLSVSASRRRSNVSGTMRVRRGLRASAWDGWTFVVIDDVKTTGATMTEACKALRRGLGEVGKTARVWAAVAAVTAEGPGRHGTPLIAPADPS